MGLAEIQAALARLYTDADFRTLLQTDPSAVQRECKLSEDDIRQLTALSASRLDFFAGSLQSKRRGEVAKLLPATTQALGSRFRPLFESFANGYRPSGEKKHAEDALAFCAYLDARRFTDGPWVKAIARYESAWLVMQNPRHRLLVRRFDYAIPGLLASVREGTALTECKRSPYMSVWFRLSRGSRVRHWLIGMQW